MPTLLEDPRSRRLEKPLDLECFEITLIDDTKAFEALTAAEKKGRLARLTYEFECMDTVGHNRRIYPRAIWAEAARNLDVQCQKGRVWGRNDHPDPWDWNCSIPTMADAAVRIVKVEAVPDTKKARVVVDVLDNEFGRQLMSLKAVGGDLCISQRGFADWQEATSEQKALYGVREQDDLVIATGLRLITYDMVSQPGFETAGNPTSESSRGTPPMKTALEVRTALPAVAAELIEEGRKSVDVPKLTSEAIAAEKPKIVEEATKPLKADLAKKDESIDALKKAFETIKPALVASGIAFETVSDAQLKARAEAAESKVTTLEATVKDLQTKLTAAESTVNTYKAKEAAEAALKPVREKYGKSVYAEQILKACDGATDEKKALELAAAKVAEIKATLEAAGAKVTEDTFTKAPAAKPPAKPLSNTNPASPEGAHGRVEGGDEDADENGSKTFRTGLAADWGR
jgi:hypothetical protein